MKEFSAHILLWCLLLLPALPLHAQPGQQKVSMSYDGELLETVLSDISERYQVRFAYSRQFIPIKEPVTVSVQNVTLSKALDQLFEPLPVSYQYIGNQVVLRPMRKPAPNQIGSRELPMEVKQESPIYTDPRLQELIEERQKKWREQLPLVQQRSYEQLAFQGGLQAGNLQDYRLEVVPEALEDRMSPNARLAQISLLPYLGTNAFRSREYTNQVSINLLWGTNGGVNGFEFGGLVNTIKEDVSGVQIAGLGNKVGGDVVGTQSAGLFNIVADSMMGLQGAGLFNISGKVTAVQGAGAFNIARKSFAGVQLAGLFNYSGGSTTGVQAAGVVNISKGAVKAQGAGLLNIGGDVESFQAAPLLNVARHVKGHQFALINVADTVSKPSFGVINLIKKGYNRVEISNNEFFKGNFAIKLGVKQFYNIFYLGGRTDKSTPVAGESSERELSWGLGYGLGTAFTLGKRSLLNLEAITMHVNEKQLWTRELNLLNQLRLTWDLRIGRQMSLFAGPSGNLLLSRRIDLDTGEIGSQIARRTLYERTRNGQQMQVWTGFMAGIRL